MSLMEKLIKLDYDYSYKLATILSMDSNIRKFFQLITQTGTYIAWAIALVLSYIFLSDHRLEVLSLVAITTVMLIPIFIIKHTVQRPRPHYRDERFGTVAFDKFSFPSGHATRATYAMIIMPFYTPDLWWVWIIWGSLMIASRLLLGVHYISDILTGMIISALTMLLFIQLNWIPIFPFVSMLPF